jgi:(E)-4-hydroxy-3-methylbut-2-enyl-diphosphate synthase
MMSPRRTSRPVFVGDVQIGGDAPVAVQSMCATDTSDVAKTVAQLNQLKEAGCDVVRIAVPDRAAAEALPEIVRQKPLPIIADIHFDYRWALAAIESGFDALRLNPGNIRDADKVKLVAQKAKERGMPIRIGVNAGSLPPIRALGEGEMPPSLPDRMVEAALWEIKVLNDVDFDDIKISMKAFDVPTMVEAYRRIAKLVDYPLHLGVTEAGTPRAGSVRSAIGIGILLAEGIGDTIRVSLAADPVEEVPVCWDILNTLNIRKRGATLVACPTCGRIEIELIPLANKVEEYFTKRGKEITVAVMGCVVNGPGEAKMADLGIAGGKGRGVIFRKGEIVKTVDEPEFMSALIEEGEKIIAEMEAGTYTPVGHGDENVIPLMEVPAR